MADDAEEPLDNAAINAAISNTANEANFVELLMAQGKPVVYLDDAGEIVVHRPDPT